jgi:hypothetical protein
MQQRLLQSARRAMRGSLPCSRQGRQNAAPRSTACKTPISEAEFCNTEERP